MGDDTNENLDKFVQIRRQLHANPELSLEEHETARLVEAILRQNGIHDITRSADTGVIAIIEGMAPGAGPTLAWRADIDALPIQELTQSPYKSLKTGVMHACGHDVHTSVALGIAANLFRRRHELRGRVKFVFQPAEEASPVNEPIGAERMALEGALTSPNVEAIFALHCMPTLDVGKIGYTNGPVWAGSHLVEIVVEGEKTHAAYPHLGKDALVIAAQLILALQNVVSRRTDARKPCVLSFGRLSAGNSYNIIADRAELTGILRTLEPVIADQAIAEINRIAQGIAAAFNAHIEVRFTEGARATINDMALETRTVGLMQLRHGIEAIVPHLPQMGAEDFSAFSSRVPGCYLFLGVRNEPRGICHSLHSPYFDVDEECIAFGIRVMTDMLIDQAANWPA